jgi:hypothetical protein
MRNENLQRRIKGQLRTHGIECRKWYRGSARKWTLPTSGRCVTLTGSGAMKTRCQLSRLSLCIAAAGFTVLATCLTARAQQAVATLAPTMASMMDAQLSMVERQLVGAAEAMPAEKYSFVPVGAEFSGVRTFALEVRHVATANFVIYSGILGQDPPPGITVAGAGNGPENLQTKDQIVRYLKDSFALGHRAMAALNSDNALTPLDHPPIAIPAFNTRLALAIFSFSHAADHYGQMVEYLRMNGIVPPASVGQPPANPATKQ